jgi:hypothetical protein
MQIGGLCVCRFSLEKSVVCQFIINQIKVDFTLSFTDADWNLIVKTIDEDVVLCGILEIRIDFNTF